jgi:hypothetical protein
VAAAASVAKKQAKKRAKNPARGPLDGSVFVERRRPGEGVQPAVRILN